MKQEDLVRTFLNLPPEGQAQVIDLIESLQERYGAATVDSNKATVDISREEFIGIWKDRDDMLDSVNWIRDLRVREWTKGSG